MSDESMIKTDGSIVGKLAKEHVTWFDFLYFSRATKSDRGGWNAATYWVARGLEVLIKSDFGRHLKQWTSNSSGRENDMYLPGKRLEDFKLNREPEFLGKRRHLLTTSGQARLEDLGLPSTGLPEKIDTTKQAEAKLNARLYARYGKRKGGEAWDGGIALLSYEVPLADASAGQLKVDLIGLDEHSLVVLELKQGGNRKDSPLMALVELICYATQITRFGEQNGFWEEIKNRSGSDILAMGKKMRLAIVAPGDYWDTWKFEEDDIKGMRSIVKTVGTALNWSLQLSAYKLNEPDDESQIAIEEFFPDEGR